MEKKGRNVARAGMRCLGGYRGWLGSGEGDSPELQRFLILLNKFNSVGAETFHRADLRDHARGHLNALLIFQCHAAADGQFARKLDGSTVPVQVGGLGSDRE